MLSTMNDLKIMLGLWRIQLFRTLHSRIMDLFVTASLYIFASVPSMNSQGLLASAVLNIPWEVS